METDPVGPTFPSHMMQAKMPGHAASAQNKAASAPTPSSSMNGGPVAGMHPPSSR